MDKIIFLGTGSGISVISKQLRASGGIVFQLKNLQFHLDPGPGALVRVNQLGLSPRETSVLLVSHHHLGHSSDLPTMIEAMTLSGFDQKGILIGNETIIKGSEEYQNLSLYHQRMLEKVICLRPKEKVAVGEVEIYGTSTSHHDPKGIGFKIVTTDYIIGYTGDTSYHAELVSDLFGSDLLIINLPFPDHQGEDQLNREEAIKLIKELNPKMVIITHFGLEMLKADPLLEAREIQRFTGVQTVAANDGLVTKPIYFDIKSEQKRLFGF